MQVLSSLFAAIAVLTLAGALSISKPGTGVTPVKPGGAQTNDGPGDMPPKR